MNILRNDLLDPSIAAGPADVGGEPRREVKRLLRMVRRNWLVLACSSIAALILGMVFVSVVEPSYRSTVRILLDQNRTGELTDAASVSEGNNLDEYIATQVAIVQSDVIYRRVAEGLRVEEDGTLRPAEGTEPGSIAPAGADEQTVLDALRRMISVYRLDRSFVIEIAANSPDPALSRYVTDAVGSAYIADQTESYAQSLTQAGNWLEERIDDLRLQSLEAAESVERFRAESGIRATEGQLISDQQLTGLSNQSVLAEANVARLQSRYDVYLAAIDNGDVITLTGLLSVSEPGGTGGLGNPGADYLAALERERAVTAALGEDNPQLPAIRSEIERLSRLVLVEARGRLASYENELEAARAQLDGIGESMRLAATRSETSNLPLVALRSLEQRANSLQTLYQTYLARHQETLQRQSLPMNGARKISDAEEAARPTFPNHKIVLAFALFLGFGVGAAISIGREFFDNALRTSEQLQRLGLETIGHAPRMRNPANPNRSARKQLVLLGRALLSAAALPAGRGPKLAAFVSAGHGEGRTFLTRILAEACADEALSAAIVDLSGAEPTPSSRDRRFVAWRFWRRGAGAASTPRPREPAPANAKLFTANSFQSLRRLSPRVDGRLPEELEGCDLIVFDLPPLTSPAELRAVAGAVDVVFVVVEWGRTDADAIRQILSSGPLLQSKIAGAVLTRVDPRRRRRYEERRHGLDG